MNSKFKLSSYTPRQNNKTAGLCQFFQISDGRSKNFDKSTIKENHGINFIEKAFLMFANLIS